MINLNKLKKLAEAATPGPWRAKSGPGWAHTYVVGELVGAYEQTIATIPEAPSKTAQFIAAANPAAILELIALASTAQDSAPAELPPLPDGYEFSATRMLTNGQLDPRYSAAQMREYGQACAAATLSRPVVAIGYISTQTFDGLVCSNNGVIMPSQMEEDDIAVYTAASASPQPVAKVLTAWEYFFIHEGTTAAAPMEIGPCITYDKKQAFGIGCIKQREVSILAASTPTTLTEKKE